MGMDTKKKAIQTIADHYGIENQLYKTFEELGELTAALARGDKPDLVSEIADVEIMLSQIKYLLGIELHVESMVAYKLARQIKRIREEVDNG